MKQVDKRSAVFKFKSPSPVRPAQVSCHDSCKGLSDTRSPTLRSLASQQSPKKLIPSPMLSPSTRNTLELDSSFLSNSRLHTEIPGQNRQKSIETTIRPSDSYQTQMHYMQEYIGFLKRKLAQAESGIPPDKYSDTLKLSEEISFLRKIIAEKDRESNNYLDELCEKQNTIFELSEKINRFEEVWKEQEKLKSRDSEERVQVERELKRFYEKKVAELQESLRGLRYDNEDKGREMDAMKVELRNRKSEVDEEIRRGRERIHQAIEGNDEKAKDFEQKILGIEGKVANLVKTVRFLQTTSLYATNSKIKKVEAELNEMFSAKLREKDSEIKVLNDEILEWKLKERRGEEVLAEVKGQLTVAKELVRKTSESLEAENNEKSMLKERLRETEADLAEWKDRSAEDQRKVKELETQLEMCFQNLRVKENELLQELIESGRKGTIISEKEFEIGILHKEKQGLTEVIGERVEEIAEKERENAELEAEVHKRGEKALEQLENIEKLERIIEDQSKTIEKFVRANERLKENLRKEKASVLEHEEKEFQQIATIREFEQKVKDLNIGNAGLVEAIENLENQLKALEIDHEQQLNSVHQEKINALRSLQSISTQESLKSSEKIIEKEEFCNKLQSEVQENKEKIVKLQLELQQSHLQRLETESNLNKVNLQLNEEISLFRLSENRLKKEISALNLANEDCKQKILEFDKEIERVSNENSDLKGRVKEINTKFMMKDKKQIEYISELEVTVADLQVSLKEIEETKSKILEKMRIDNAEAERMQKELLGDIELYQNELKELQAFNSQKVYEVQGLESKAEELQFRLASEAQRSALKLAEKSAELTEKNEKILMAEQKSSKLAESIALLKEKIRENERIIYTTSADLKDSTEKVANFLQSEEKLKEKVFDQETVIENLKETIEQLTAKASRLEFMIQDSQSLLVKRAESYRASLESSDSTICEQSSQIKSLESQVQSLQFELKSSKMRSLEAESAFLQEIRDLKLKIEDLHYKEKSAQAAHLESLKINSELKTKLNSFDLKLTKFAEENAQIKETLHKSELTHQLKQSDLEKSLSLLEDSESSLKSLLKQATESKASDLKFFQAATESKELQFQGLVKEIEDYRKSIENLQTSNHNLQGKISRLESNIEELEEIHSNEVKALNKRLADKTEELLSTHEGKNSEEALNSSLKQINAENEERIAGFNQKLQQLERRQKIIESEKESLSESLRSLSADLDSERKAKKVFEENLIRKKAEVAELEELIERIKSEFYQETGILKENYERQRENAGRASREAQVFNEKVEDVLVENNLLKVRLLESENYLNRLSMNIAEEQDRARNCERRLTREIEGLCREKSSLLATLQQFEEKSAQIVMENQELSGVNEENRKKMLEGQRLHKKMQHELQENLKKVKSLEKEIEDAQEKLKTAGETIEDLKERNRDYEKSLEKCKKFEEIKEKEIETYKSQVLQYERSINQLKEDYNSILNRVASLETELESNNYIREKALSLESELATVKEINVELKCEIDQLTNEKSEISQKLGNKLKELEHENEFLQTSVKNSEFSLEYNAKTHKHELLKQENKINRLNFELEERMRSLQTSESRISQLNQKLSEFLADFPEEDHEMLQSLYSKLKETGKDLECEDIDIDKLRNSVKRLRQQLQSSSNEVNKLKAANEQLRSEISANMLQSVEVEAKYLKQVQRLEEDLKIITMSEEKKVKDLQRLQQKYHELTENHEALDAQIQRVSLEKNAMSGRMEETTSRTSKLINDKDTLIASLTEEKNYLKVSLAELRSAHTKEKLDYSTALHQQEAITRSLTAELETLKSDLSQAKSSLNAKLSKISELESSLSSLTQSSQREIEDLTHQLSTLTSDFSELEDSKSQLLSAHESALSNLTSMLAENSKLHLRLSALEQETQEHLLTIDRLTSSMESAGLLDVIKLKEQLVELETKVILDGYQIEKSEMEIKRLKNINEQKMNNYKIEVLEKELEVKKDEVKNLLVENQRLGVEARENRDKAEVKTRIVEVMMEGEAILDRIVNFGGFSGKDQAEILEKGKAHVQKIKAFKLEG